ncbi:Putative zn(2)-C6 fungal-type DNA-binding domain-containing protein [Septoria linicola]|uniref:Zn(2)-C6 fungal-type DNA-binding domain-containing protein n=1 Tax=Septoria linicola TaxID=215465 RepID=A0A9Q9EKL2_9PEZI|nr:putative zn(2)-C6 fungal-type DNA-binding domain-containing protein [Septoria linicola]USW52503.1 Putative zn(2)-C6 fungal-type DNA-binding domain-containing protein [Septoria linicola]
MTGDTTPHPSQQRSSCENCRRRKTRCHRQHSNDARCVRCTAARKVCVLGPQKKVGRPTRAAPRPGADIVALQSDGAAATITTRQAAVATTSPPSGSHLEPALLSVPFALPSPSTALITRPSRANAADAFKSIARVREFALGSLVTFYVRDNAFLTAPGSYMAGYPGIGSDEAHSRLFDVRHGLHRRTTMISSSQSDLDLDLLIYRWGPLSLDNMSLGEYLLFALQEHLQVLKGLRNNWHSNNDLCRRLPATLVAQIIGVYVYVLCISEALVEQLIVRVECITTKPVVPVPGMLLDSVPLTNSAAQGVLFCSTIINLLGRAAAHPGSDTTCSKRSAVDGAD